MPRWVVLTNTSRGVYFGELRNEPAAGESAVLYNARHCFTWRAHPESKGVWGLAVLGPAEGSQVGPTIPRLTIGSGWQFADCTPEAVEAWHKSTWKVTSYQGRAE